MRQVSSLGAAAEIAQLCSVPFPTDPDLSREEMRLQLRAWCAGQMRILARAFGDGWPERRGWIERLLVQEVRVRLAEIGWRLRE